MRVVGYARVSTDEQAEHGFGLEVQEGVIRQWVRRAGRDTYHSDTAVVSPRYRLVEMFRDEGVSGANGIEERVGLPLALQAIQDGEAEGIVVARLDRLARALTVHEAVLAKLWQMGGRLYSVNEGGEVLPDDPDDPMRTAMRQMVGVFAELDKGMTVKRLRDGRAAKAAAGRHASGVYPFGYRGEDKEAVPDEAEQRAIRRITALRRAGASYRVIAATLDDEGLPPRRAERWSAMAVRKIARREGA